MLHRLTLCSILFVFTLATHAAGGPTIYKWVDENGEIHYSQKLPPGHEGEKMRGAPPPADDPEAIRSNISEQLDTLETQKKEQVQGAEDAEQWAEIQKLRRENCATARQNLTNLQRGGNVRYVGGDGQVYRLSEDDRQQRMEEAKKQIEENCEK